MTQVGWWQTVQPGDMQHNMRMLEEEGIDLSQDSSSTITVLRYWERFDGLKLLETNLLRLSNVESIVRARRLYLASKASKH